MDGAAHAPALLDVNLGQMVTIKDGRLREIADAFRCHDVLHLVPLDRLVLGDALGAVVAADEPDEAAAMLVAAAVPALEGL